MSKLSNNHISFKQSVVLGFVLVALMFVFYCSHFPILANFNTVETGKGVFSVFGVDSPLLFGILLFTIVFLKILLPDKIPNRVNLFHSNPFKHSFYRLSDIISKLNNYILRAFSLGIAHPKVY